MWTQNSSVFKFESRVVDRLFKVESDCVLFEAVVVLKARLIPCSAAISEPRAIILHASQLRITVTHLRSLLVDL